MPTVYQLALMAEDIYAQDESGIYAASFSESVSSDLPDRSSYARLTQVSEAGFAAALYDTGDGKTIIYRGTDTSAAAGPSDENVQDVPPQFARAIAFAQDAIDHFTLDPANTCLCGHSMGGALAEYVARDLAEQGWLAIAAVSFNAPSLTASLLDKAVVAGMSQLTEDHSVGVGITAVHEMIQQIDQVDTAQTNARLVSISVDGDIVSKIGEPSGLSFTLTAPEFITPPDFELSGDVPLPHGSYAKYIVLREVYRHSMHTLRRVLADDPLGARQINTLFDNTVS